MMMRTVSALTLSLILLAANAGVPSRTPGAELSHSKGIAVMYLTVLANDPGVARIRFSKRQFFGPADAVEVELGSTTMIVRDMFDGQYGWYDLWSTTHGATVNLKKTLPEFIVKPGCITYAGEITLDLRDKTPKVNFERQDEGKAFAALRQQYPQELAKYACG